MPRKNPRTRLFKPKPPNNHKMLLSLETCRHRLTYKWTSLSQNSHSYSLVVIHRRWSFGPGWTNSTYVNVHHLSLQFCYQETKLQATPHEAVQGCQKQSKTRGGKAFNSYIGCNVSSQVLLSRYELCMLYHADSPTFKTKWGWSKQLYLLHDWRNYHVLFLCTPYFMAAIVSDIPDFEASSGNIW